MMEFRSPHAMFARRSTAKSRPPAARWHKVWVPQETAATEDSLKALEQNQKEPEPEDVKPEPTTEVLYLCNYEGCNKSFPNESGYRKHAHIHGERQYACTYPGCFKKFLDSSKLKRHQVVHTGVKDFICKYEGCGKAFNLDFNLRAHMKTHEQAHYHVCPYADCGKRYTQECKLKTHIRLHHEKNNGAEKTKRAQPVSKMHSAAKTSSAVKSDSPSAARPYVCFFEGCGKDYIHEYKLRHHLKQSHGVFDPEESTKSKNSKRKTPSFTNEMPPAKVAYRRLESSPVNITTVKKPWPIHGMMNDEDSEETEEEQENITDDRWRFHENGDDDEETEEED